jgi:hypothetical protein
MEERGLREDGVEEADGLGTVPSAAEAGEMCAVRGLAVGACEGGGAGIWLREWEDRF